MNHCMRHCMRHCIRHCVRQPMCHEPWKLCLSIVVVNRLCNEWELQAGATGWSYRQELQAGGTGDCVATNASRRLCCNKCKWPKSALWSLATNASDQRALLQRTTHHLPHQPTRHHLTFNANPRSIFLCFLERFDFFRTGQKHWKTFTARPYESCKIFKGRPRRNAFSTLVHRQYKSFPTDRFCQTEIKKTIGLSNKHRTA